MTSIPAALATVITDIRTFEQRHDRKPHSVQLLAVSKTRPATDIQAAIDAGQLAFGENYLDEAVQKIDTLKGHNINWHYIGAIQSRKTRSIASHFDWAHSVDRLKVALRLSNQRREYLSTLAGSDQTTGTSRPNTALNICLQVNTDNEPGKAGISYAELDELADACADLPGIRLRGLMAIPAPRTQFDAQRAAFARLRECFEKLQMRHTSMDTLSIGMSGDMEAAIAEGATIVRIGTAIFGSR
jgi:pyridoxal phosphate enzyme (YggS family)